MRERRKEGERKLPLTWDKTKKKERAKQFGGMRTIRRKKRKGGKERKNKEKQTRESRA